MKLEIAVGSLESALAAANGGTDRLELNNALSLGGLTPSPGLLREVRGAVSLELITMARPRQGGFCYTQSEFRTLLSDVEVALKFGVDGIAFGVLTASGEVDVVRAAEVVRLVGEKQTVFHRAFDLTPDPTQALEQLISLGVTRVLTSGQAATALRGAQQLARLRQLAGDRIEVLPGSGINAENVAELLAQTGCNQVHASLRRYRSDPTSILKPGIDFGPAEVDYLREEDVRLLRQAMETFPKI